jgi:hypothetical protein
MRQGQCKLSLSPPGTSEKHQLQLTVTGSSLDSEFRVGNASLTRTLEVIMIKVPNLKPLMCTHWHCRGECPCLFHSGYHACAQSLAPAPGRRPSPAAASPRSPRSIDAPAGIIHGRGHGASGLSRLGSRPNSGFRGMILESRLPNPSPSPCQLELETRTPTPDTQIPIPGPNRDSTPVWADIPSRQTRPRQLET